MPHIHWVAQQNKLEIPRDKDEVNKQDIHECDGRAHDPDTMVAPPTPKPTRKAEALARAPPTIASSREEDAALKEVALPRYRCASCMVDLARVLVRKRKLHHGVERPLLVCSLIGGREQSPMSGK